MCEYAQILCKRSKTEPLPVQTLIEEQGKTDIQNKPLARIAKVSIGWLKTQEMTMDDYDLGRLAPYLERPCLRSLTPAVSSVPRIM